MHRRGLLTRLLAGLAGLLAAPRGGAAAPPAPPAAPAPTSPAAVPAVPAQPKTPPAPIAPPGPPRAVDFPPPRALRPGGAALAAVCAARGWGATVGADGDTWRYDDGGGNWACLRHAGEGRWVLFGHDHEYSDTYFREAAAYFDAPETDLLAGAPAWWGERLQPPFADRWIGFVYGFEDGQWRRADYPADDGFAALDLAAAFSLVGITTLGELAGGDDDPPPEAALRALLDADGMVTEAQLRAAMRGDGLDLAAGVAAARAFHAMPL